MKFLLTLILSVILATTALGQQNKFEIGVEGGPSIIFLRKNINTGELYKPAFGFSGGIFLQSNFSSIFSIRTNIAFERKGEIYTGKYLLGLTMPSRNLNFDYLTLPILVRATLGKKVNYFINAGPFFGYLIKHTAIIKDPNIQQNTTDFTNFYNRFDTGISAGLGISVPIKEKFSISCEIRNNLGLYKISDSPYLIASRFPIESTIKTNSTNLLIGLGYKLGSK